MSKKKPTKKVVVKLPTKKAAPKNSLTEKSLDADIQKIMTKHKIHNGIFIATVPKKNSKVSRIVSVFNTDKQEESLLLDAVMNLITRVNLNSSDISTLCRNIDYGNQRLKEEQEELHLKKSFEDVNYALLSVDEKVQVDFFRKLKNEAVKLNKFEEGARYREMELMILSPKKKKK